MLPSGPPIDDDGNMPGNTGTWGGQPTEPYRLLYQVGDAKGFVFCVLFQCVCCLPLLPNRLRGIPALLAISQEEETLGIQITSRV